MILELSDDDFVVMKVSIKGGVSLYARVELTTEAYVGLLTALLADAGKGEFTLTQVEM